MGSPSRNPRRSPRQHRPRRPPRPTAYARPTTPHDALFKGVFSRPEEAAGLLRTAFPPAILARLDLTTLVPQPGSFIDARLAARHSDLLFSAQLDGHPALVYFLCEHQSSVHPLMAFRLLAYMVRIWEDHLAKHPHARRLPAILPIVVHHGPTGWSAAVAFEELLDLDPHTLAAIRKYVPHFVFVLDDLTDETDDALRRRAMSALGRLCVFCLKHGRDASDLVRRLAGWLMLVRETRRAPSGAAALSMIWHYVVAVSGPSPERVLDKLLDVADPTTREEIVNIQTYLMNEGRIDGERRIVLKQLTARFGALPDTAVKRIQAATTRQLERWAQRLLTAASLDEVLGRQRARS